MSSVALQSLLVQIKLHAEHKVRILNHPVGDQKGHGGQGCQTIHLADANEKQRDGRDDKKRIDWDLVWAFL